MAKLVVAEKPSVGRDIARVLGAKEKGEGFLRGGEWVVTWAIGHLVSLCEPDEIDERYKRWRMDTLPILPETIPTKVLPKTKAQFSIVKKWMNSKEIASIVCATDAGREGELIFRYIYEKAGCKKPVERLWISSMTDSAIRAGFAALAPSAKYDALYMSARCRSEADWLVGMNASRAFSLSFDARLPIGRVQTPTLALIAARDAEIERFVPRDYFELTADFGDYKGVWHNSAEKDGRAYDRAAAEAVKAAIAGKTGRVVEVKNERKRTPPPQLYDLTALQRDANTRLGFSAERTLKAAQNLYEKSKLITYPRTDSRVLPNDMAPKVPAALAAVPAPLKPFAQAVLEKPLARTKRIYDDAKVTDHHAIIPTGHTTSSLAGDEAAIFDLVCRRLIAVHMADSVQDNTKVCTRVEGYDFLSAGATPIEEGWRALYREAPKDAQTLPPLREGEERDVRGASIRKKTTRPPARHTDASLLGMMENAGNLVEDEELRARMKASGLGTPATRAAILERLIQVGYVKRQGKTLVSTQKGRDLVRVVPDEIRSAETTGKWERALYTMAQADAETARRKAQRFLESIGRFSAFLVQSAVRADHSVKFEKTEFRRIKSRKAPQKPS